MMLTASSPVEEGFSACDIVGCPLSSALLTSGAAAVQQHQSLQKGAGVFCSKRLAGGAGSIVEASILCSQILNTSIVSYTSDILQMILTLLSCPSPRSDRGTLLRASDVGSCRDLEPRRGEPT